MKFNMARNYTINGTQLAFVFVCLAQEDIEAARKELEDVILAQTENKEVKP
jgi:hypothetical protein